jgi:hypothetical protein
MPRHFLNMHIRAICTGAVRYVASKQFRMPLLHSRLLQICTVLSLSTCHPFVNHYLCCKFNLQGWQHRFSIYSRLATALALLTTAREYVTVQGSPVVHFSFVHLPRWELLRRLVRLFRLITLVTVHWLHWLHCYVDNVIYGTFHISYIGFCILVRFVKLVR